MGTNRKLRNGNYALNFLAFGTFSPLSIRSAPTFFPLEGQPDLGPKRPQELLHRMIKKLAVTSTVFWIFITGLQWIFNAL